MNTLGIDIGGTFIKYALVDEEYEMVSQWKIPTGSMKDKDAFYDHLASGWQDRGEFDSVGVCAPGLIGPDGRVNTYAAPGVDAMYHTNVPEEIEKRCSKKAAAINDAKAAGLCEFRLGNARDAESSVCILIGTGIGGCYCDRNGVVLGQGGCAGELHFLPAFDPERGRFEKMGNLCSMTGLVWLYHKLSGKEEPALGEGREVLRRYLEGEECAIHTVEEWLYRLSMYLIAVEAVYDPQVICIGGGVSEEEWFLKKLTEVHHKEFLRYFRSDEMFLQTEVRRCRFANGSNILGAVLNVRGQQPDQR